MRRSLPPLSSRHAIGLCVLITLALVPTIIHSYVGFILNDGRSVSTITSSLSEFPSAASKRSASWFVEQFASTEAVERTYDIGNGPVTLTAIRSYDLKALYHHPELVVAYHTEFDHEETVRFPVAPNVPVHVLVSTAAPTQSVGMYVLHYDGQYIDNPIAFQLKTAARLLVRGRKPMTLIFARGTMSAPAADLARTDVARILRAAVAAFDRPDADSRH